MTRATAITVLGLVALVGGCGGGASSPRGAPRPAGALARDSELLEGRRIYVDRCSACHGIAGEGKVGPRFDDGHLLRLFPKLDAQATFVAEGRGAMPAFGSSLTDDEIRAVVRYEREILSEQAGR